MVFKQRLMNILLLALKGHKTCSRVGVYVTAASNGRQMIFNWWWGTVAWGVVKHSGGK